MKTRREYAKLWQQVDEMKMLLSPALESTRILKGIRAELEGRQRAVIGSDCTKQMDI